MSFVSVSVVFAVALVVLATAAALLAYPDRCGRGGSRIMCGRSWVEMGDRTRVGALSAVPKFATLAARAVYAGAPVRRIDAPG